MTDKERIKEWAENNLSDVESKIKGMFGLSENLYPDLIAKRVVLKDLLFLINSIQEEPVSEELEEAANDFAEGEWDGLHDNDGNALYEQDYVEYAFKAGAKWQKEQFEKNRLKHCDSITNEQAELESEFVSSHIDKYNRMPTFLDAIEYGMKLQENQDQETIELAEDHAMLAGMEKMREEMMEKAVECELIEYPDGTLAFQTKTLTDDDMEARGICLFDYDKVKLIIIKEEE